MNYFRLVGGCIGLAVGLLLNGFAVKQEISYPDGQPGKYTLSVLGVVIDQDDVPAMKPGGKVEWPSQVRSSATALAYVFGFGGAGLGWLIAAAIGRRNQKGGEARLVDTSSGLA